MSSNKILYLGIDIGGANLKIVGLNNYKEIIFVSQIKCHLWEEFHNLNKYFVLLNKKINARTLCGITMTGELCDNFNSRKDGVKKIINLTKQLESKNFFFTNINNGSFKKKAKFCSIASMNWLATGKFVSKKLEKVLLIDFGSTTTDLILIRNNKVVNKYHDDFSRLNNHELIYTGFLRTPLIGISNKIKHNGSSVKIVPEIFSNTSDLYKIKKILRKNKYSYETADNRGKNIKNSYKRLARNIGLDYSVNIREKLDKFCEKLIEIQFECIFSSIKKILESNKCDLNSTPLIFCGVGGQYLKAKIKKKKINILNFEDLVIGEKNLLLKSTFHAPATACAFLVAEKK